MHGVKNLKKDAAVFGRPVIIHYCIQYSSMV